MVQDLLVGQSVQNPGDADCACSCAAGQGLAGAAFPCSLADFGAGDYLYELDIRSSGEKVMILDEGAVLFHLEVVHVIDKDDAVGISHGDHRNMKDRMEDVQRLVDRLVSGRFTEHRYFGFCEPGFTHVHTY